MVKGKKGKFRVKVDFKQVHEPVRITELKVGLPINQVSKLVGTSRTCFVRI